MGHHHPDSDHEHGNDNPWRVVIIIIVIKPIDDRGQDAWCSAVGYQVFTCWSTNWSN